MDWFRYYTETLESRKVQKLPLVLFKAWVNLLCVARIFDGVIPNNEEVAYRLRCTEKQADDWILSLIEKRLLDTLPSGEIIPHDWGEHQRESDDAASRMRRARTSKKFGTKTEHVQNAGRTCSVLEQSRADTEQIQIRAEQAHSQNRNGDSMVIRSTPEWKTDPEFRAFTSDYLKTGGAFIDEDFQEAFQFNWKPLDFEQRAERHKALIEKLASGYFDNPAMVPRPKNFLAKEWKRPAPAKAKSKQQQNVDAWDAVIDNLPGVAG